jgi:hypothetical protein
MEVVQQKNLREKEIERMITKSLGMKNDHSVLTIRSDGEQARKK